MPVNSYSDNPISSMESATHHGLQLRPGITFCRNSSRILPGAEGNHRIGGWQARMASAIWNRSCVSEQDMPRARRYQRIHREGMDDHSKEDNQ